MSSSSTGGSPPSGSSTSNSPPSLSSSNSSPSSSSSPPNNSNSQSPPSNNDSSSGNDDNSSSSGDDSSNNNNNSKNSNSQSPPSNNNNSNSQSPPSNDGSSSGNNNNNNNNSNSQSPPSNDGSSSGSNNNNNNNNLNSQSPPSNDGSSSENNNNNHNSNNNNNDHSNNNNGNNNNNNGNSSNNKSRSSPKSSGGSSPHLPPPSQQSPSQYSPNRAIPPPRPPTSGLNHVENRKTLRIGVAVGAGLLLLVVIVCLVSCCKRKKKRRQHHDQMGYYRDNSQGPMSMNSHNYYNNSGTRGNNNNWQNSNKLPTDQFSKIPSGQVSSEHGWPIAPPPPPPMMSSSEISSAAFSGPALPPPHPSMALGFNQSSFTYDDLAAATGGFAKANLLGQGGFGYVHKGVLPNGKEVAVKSLKANSGQGEREFQAEVEIISRVHHRHLVSLVGYCIAGSQRMLVYEFISNNTLEYHLHGSGRPPVDFNTRHKIALGAAKGFAYLHEDCHPKIIHRDIKAANILLDENFESKVADFGLAKLSSDTNTHVSTRIMGTFGYLAPEYASSGKLTEKSDVYSYGVMLLELITGKRPICMDMDSDDDTLVEWARPILLRATEGGDYDELIDPRLEGKFDAQQMLCMVACAAASIRHSAKRRPKMSQIVRALEDDVTLDDLNEGGKLGHSATLSSASSDQDGGSYDLKKFRKSSMSSQDLSSCEHSAVQSGGESREFRPNRK